MCTSVFKNVRYSDHLKASHMVQLSISSPWQVCFELGGPGVQSFFPVKCNDVKFSILVFGYKFTCSHIDISLNCCTPLFPLDNFCSVAQLIVV